MFSRCLNKRMKFVRGALCGVLLGACPGGSLAQDNVQALRYGVSLFHYFQQDYFDALTELMAARQLEQLGAHANDAELLRGGISLSYGMDRVAEEIFADLLSGSESSADRERAWFYLGKIAWQRGESARAGNALAQMSPDYSGDLADEATYLRASIDLRQGNLPGAVRHMQQLPEESSWRFYLYYNLGADHASRGEWATSSDYFGEFGALPVASLEINALRDKALTASGFSHMAAGDFDRATLDFSKVSLEGPLSGRALLGYGWALSEQGDYQGALSPWLALGDRSMLGESARESLLAVPYAYARLERPGLALAGYEQASGKYSAELESLHKAIDTFSTGDIEPLLGLDGETSGEWLFNADILPDGPYAPYLQYLISRHGFQIALRELRDLHHIAGQLEHAGQRLQVLAEVDSHQQQVWSTVDQGERRAQLVRTREVLAHKFLELRQRLEVAEAQGNGRVLADTRQSELWLQLERAAELAVTVGAGQQQQDTLRLLRGLLIWEDNERYPHRAWLLQREMAELQALLAQSELALQAVDQAIEQRRQSGFAKRIELLNRRVQERLIAVRQTIGVSETSVRQIAVAELERQAGELSRSLGQARLAIARLYDQGSPEIPR